ncbi:hypothetical protein FB451DRAFT_1185794 [Mycena latifolia]|nr:hypothetical protein FB451DRAFT_1185794 [Mycena latifolia]
MHEDVSIPGEEEHHDLEFSRERKEGNGRGLGAGDIADAGGQTGGVDLGCTLEPSPLNFESGYQISLLTAAIPAGRKVGTSLLEQTPQGPEINISTGLVAEGSIPLSDSRRFEEMQPSGVEGWNGPLTDYPPFRTSSLTPRYIGHQSADSFFHRGYGASEHNPPEPYEITPTKPIRATPVPHACTAYSSIDVLFHSTLLRHFWDRSTTFCYTLEPHFPDFRPIYLSTSPELGSSTPGSHVLEKTSAWAYAEKEVDQYTTLGR